MSATTTPRAGRHTAPPASPAGRPAPVASGVPAGRVRYAAAPPPRPRSRLRSGVSAAWPVVASIAAGLLVWQLVAAFLMGDRPFLLPPPLEVLQTALLDGSHLSRLLGALWLTTRIALLGLALATALGVALAVVMSQWAVMEKAIFPYAVLLQTLPVLALVPLVGLWLGFGTPSRTLVVVLFALFPMISTTLFGLQSVEAGVHDLFTIRRAGRWQRLVKLMLPAALPSVFVGLRTSSGLAVIGAVVGDMFFAQGKPGIGTLVNLYTARLQSADLYAAIILASALGIVVFAAFTLLARVVVGSWHVSARRHE